MPDAPDPTPQPRVSCPTCGKRFRVDPSDLDAKGTAGAPARCSGCGGAFRVRLGAGGELVVVEEDEGPGRATPSGKKRPPAGRSPKKPRQPRSVPGPRAAPERPASEEPLPAPEGPDRGERIGRYEVEALLGRGGMAAVYRAFDPAANRQVALKILSADAPPEDKLRFQREVQVQANIQHAHIMPIFDSGTLGVARYFAMELLSAPQSLTSLVHLAREGQAAKDPKLRPLSTLDGLIQRVVLPVCQAIHHANVREGVIHRDLKPDNVLVDANGLRPFVIDYGICSLIERKNQRLAHLPKETPARLAGGGVRVTGTLMYMPPEQARGEVDRRGDVWAIGAILHFLLTGSSPLASASKSALPQQERIEGLRLLTEQAERERKPKEAAAFRQKILRIEKGLERTIEDLQRDVLDGNYLSRPRGTPRALEAIIRKAMAVEPEDRYRHALELHDDLRAFLEGRAVRAEMQRVDPVRRAFYRTGLFLKRHRWAAALLLLGGVAGAWGAWSLLGGSRARAPGADLATRTLEKARTALERGAPANEVRRLLAPVLGEDARTQEALELIRESEAREAWDTAVSHARALGQQVIRAFEEGRDEDRRELQARLRESWEQDLLPRFFVDQETGPVTPTELGWLGQLVEGTTSVRVEGVTEPYAPILVVPQEGRAGRIRWQDVQTKKLGWLDLDHGHWILGVHGTGGQVWIPFEVTFTPEGRLTAPCPVDPARVPEGMVYVAPGTVRGPLGEEKVDALLWEPTEVTVARYATWLATLPVEERVRRVPREAGLLGGSSRPLWERSGDQFLPPPGGGSRPVENVSYHDARAFAGAQGARLPTAAEWAWAASGPDGRPCPLGSLSVLAAGEVQIDCLAEGPGLVAGRPDDRSPYGLHDMAGGVRELTSTQATLRGERGWLVMGGGYTTSLVKAFVTEADVVAGWSPQRGVGFRLVQDLAALRPVPKTEATKDAAGD